MTHYTFQREAGWIIIVGPGHEKGTGKHFDPGKSYLMKDAQEFLEALDKAYDAGRLDAMNLMQKDEPPYANDPSYQENLDTLRKFNATRQKTER